VSYNFPISWQQIPLEDALDALIDYRGKTPKKVGNGIPLITAKVVKSGRILPMDEFIADEDYESWMVRGIPQVGDIVVTTEAPLGEVAQIKDANVALAQRIVTLRGKVDFLENNFLLFLMQSNFVQNQLEARATGSTVKGIKQSELRKVILPIPPINEQKSIGKILSDLDDKIHLNNQINQTLESIAQAIFKSWFIDFEPVRAKIAAKQAGQDPELAAMCAISGKSEAELDQLTKEDFAELQATAALFPDELVESELGEVPRGWELQQIKDIAKYCTNKISLRDLTLENYISTENMLPEKKGIEKASSLPKANSVPEFRKGNILVSNIRPYFKKIWLSSFGGGHSNDVLNFEVLEKETEEYLYNLIYQDSFFDQMMASSKGSKMPRGDKKAIMDFQIVTSSVTLRKLYSEKVRKFYSKQNSIKIENQILINLRDALLPKLLSGEVDSSNLTSEV
jgi:type I restriction enzyme, S subunit